MATEDTPGTGPMFSHGVKSRAGAIDGSPHRGSSAGSPTSRVASPRRGTPSSQNQEELTMTCSLRLAALGLAPRGRIALAIAALALLAPARTQAVQSHVQASSDQVEV